MFHQSTIDIMRMLRSEMLTLMTAFIGAAGYCWTWLNVYPITGRSAPLQSWVGGALLLGGAVGVHLVKRRSVEASIYLFAFVLFGGVLCLIYTFLTPTLLLLLIVPIMFANEMISRPFFFLFSAAAVVFALWGPHQFAALPLPISEHALITLIIVVITLILWLYAHSHHTWLQWFSMAYEQAHHNERIARERQAELRRLVRALDDATDRLERANKRLRVERNRAESARQMKQQLAQNISHELRTPLNIIIGFADLMAQMPEYYGEPLPPAYMRDMSILYRNARHLQKLMNDVLDLARVEAAQTALVMERTAVVPFLNDVAEMARSLVTARGLTLHVDVQPDIPDVWMDETRIRQVLLNLINNAVRFTEQGTITIGARRRQSDVLFTVKDTGIGISAEHLPHIFEEFYQLDSGMSRRHSGVGLGLAISKRFVELHNGSIWAESAPGKGSTFYFSLPLRKTEAVTTHDAGGSRSDADSENEDVLMIVTNSTAAASLAMQLQLPSTQTHVVRSLREAKEAAAVLLPRWVIIDAANQSVKNYAELIESWGLSETILIECELLRNHSVTSHTAFDGFLLKPILPKGVWEALRIWEQFTHHILIIDNDADTVRLLTRIFQDPKHGYQVSCAFNLEEGLRLLDHLAADTVPPT